MEKEWEREEFESRTVRVIGQSGVALLQNARVAVFGIGGVGGYVAEALARAGVGAIDLVDSDRVSLSNCNRQIIALRSTVGEYKADVMQKRIADINPACRVTVHRCFFLPENADEFDFSAYTYVADAVDTVSAKIELVLRARAANVPIISAMGAGNKRRPGGFTVADISKTTVCPLARVMRLELRKRGIHHLKVVYSAEIPTLPPDGGARPLPGSLSFVPGVAGLMMAGEIVNDILASDTENTNTKKEG